MRPQVFNLVRGPLEGRNLVEASAGTGKTYTIAGLFVRLLLEARLGVDQILVVTFTEAATEELRDRIRRRIRDAVEAFRAGESGGDDLLAGLLSDPAIDREWAAGWLRNALWGFDEAAVHTIHGFCQRVLAEKAFECGAPFEAEVTPDESGLLEEVVADYWRRELHGAPSGFLHYLQDRKVTLQALTRFASDWAGAPNLAVVPEGAVPPSAEGEAAVREAYRRVQELWRATGPEVARLLAEAPGVHRGKYKPRMVPQFAREMDVFAAAGDPLAPCEALPRWSASAVAAAATKGFAPLEHPFFEACQELLELRDALEEEHGARLLALKQGLLGWVRQELPRWKAQRNLRSFDDLLRDVHAALAGPAGPGLAAALSARYRAALIDEFQDTDPVQYEIFRRAFGGAGARLFLIGDPKQAIYSFRGADLFAYLDAAREAEARFTLDRNWRSTPDLLAAVNALFGRREAPFLFEDIGYQAVHSGEPGGKEPLRFDGAPDTAPFQVWFAPRGEAKLLDKASAWADIPRAVAGEVVRLLRAGQEGRATIGGRPVAPEHIACLVRTNRQAQLVQDALREGGVPSVIHGASSLFASREAEEMLRLLAALAEPGREGRVRAALATDLLGVGGEDLHDLAADDLAWDVRLTRFRRYHELWSGGGFVAAARAVLAEEGVRARLLAYADGERRLTNVLHCVEVLQRAAVEGGLGPEALLQWLGRRVEEAGEDDGRREAEEYQIRLESDAAAVQVVTIHKAKGLEYPIVFCPFAWEGLRATKADDPAVFHGPEDGRRLVLDLGSPDLVRHRALAQREELAEGLRLLYVAVTRARQRTYLVWGRYKETETSALGYLLHGPAGAGTLPLEEVVGATAESLARLDDGALRDGLAALSTAACGRVGVADLPPGPGQRYAERAGGEEVFEARPPPDAIPADWGLASFSGFTSGSWERGAHPDRDALGPRAPEETREADGPEREGPSAPSIFSFPRGARAGSCLHAVFEDLEFAGAGPAEVRRVAAEKLALHGFGFEWRETVARMVEDVLAAPVLGPADPFRLGKLGGGDRLTELEFHLPIGRVSREGLARVFQEHGGPDLPRDFTGRLGELGFRPARGLLKGFIDLVFRSGGKVYLLDWKSNHLGDAASDYGPEALQTAMAEHYYHLQYHLYAVALHRYLRLRVPGYRYEEHCGGAVYVFLRGVGAGGSRGVYRALPARGVVEALDRYFGGGGRAGV